MPATPSNPSAHSTTVPDTPNQEPRDVKPLLPATMGAPLCTEQLQESWSQSPLNSVSLDYMLTTQQKIEKMRWMLARSEDFHACAAGYRRYVENKKEFFLIPAPLECDRVYLRHRADAAYIEAASLYLRGISSVLPILTESVWKYPTVGSLGARVRARNWAVGAAEASLYYNRLISPLDWAAFSRTTEHGRFISPNSGHGSMLISHSRFPKLPAKLADLKPCPHIPVETPRIGYYFGVTVASKADPVLQERYQEAYMLEYSINFMTGFLQERERGRIWDVRAEYELLLKEYLPKLPSIPLANKIPPKTYMGDFDNVITHSNPWRTFEEVVLDTEVRFFQGVEVYSARKLSSSIGGSFIDTTSVPDTVESNNASSEHSSELPDMLSELPPPQQPPAPSQTRGRKRPRSATTLDRRQHETRRRKRLARKCKRSE